MLLILYPDHFQGWIIFHFPRITGFESASAYSEDWPHADAFVSYRGNGVVESFRVSLEHMVPDGVCFCTYVGHC